ncbi:MAG: 2-amino-4-hydroxy-6-hydroxymethyldihydropteridine diphosphokinase [Acidimicrobiia bacterium]
MTRYAVGLGSNVGDRLGHIQRARAGLDELGTSVIVSPLYESAPVGGPDQDPYLNAVAVLDSNLTPDELLARLHDIEHQEGREREVHWGPRTLDLDIVSSDNPPIDTEDLTVPHPRAVEREFVLRPLVEVWPEAPVAPGVAASDALTGVGAQGVDLLARSWGPQRPTWPGFALVGGQIALILALAVTLALDAEIPENGVTVSLVAGAASALLGLGLALAAVLRLGDSLTASPIPLPNSSMVDSGPYRHVRHPIYGGISLMAIGASLMLDSLWGMAVSLVLLAYLWVKSSYEERQLRMRYAGYRGYRERVTKRLIPMLL